jgi:hypothetical protein
MSKPLFQKRHYEVIAKTIREMPDSTKIGEVRQITETLVTLFRMDNPKFNEAKFWKAIENGSNK